MNTGWKCSGGHREQEMDSRKMVLWWVGAWSTEGRAAGLDPPQRGLLQGRRAKVGQGDGGCGGTWAESQAACGRFTPRQAGRRGSPAKRERAERREVWRVEPFHHSAASDQQLVSSWRLLSSTPQVQLLSKTQNPISAGLSQSCFCLFLFPAQSEYRTRGHRWVRNHHASKPYFSQ